MKTPFKLFFNAILLALFCQQVCSQSTIVGIGLAGHAGGVANRYVGWQNANPLWFRTNDATNARNRMIIADGNYSATAGQIAMGNNLPNNFNPTARLHLHQNVASKNFISFTHAGTQATSTDGLRIGIDSSGNAEFRQQELFPMTFWTRDPSTNNIMERMRITPAGVMGVGITNPDPESQVNVAGAIRWSPIGITTDSIYADKTILYGFCNRGGVPNDDGFRFRYKNNFFKGPPGSPHDALVIEKTDGNNAVPDQGNSGIAFTNRGHQQSTPPGTERLQTSMVIKGDGKIGVGPIFGPHEGNIIGPYKHPGNRLEINAESDSNLVSTITGHSGLKFTNLNNTFIPVPNTGQMGLLSIDSLGNVIYVTGGGTGFGAACTGTPFNLTSNWRVRLGGHNLFFDGNNQGDTVNNILIGKTCGDLAEAKLDVKQSSDSLYTIGIKVLNTDRRGIGIKAVVNNLTNVHTAGWFEALGNDSMNQRAIIVPPNGGYIGFGTLNPIVRMHVVGNGYIQGNVTIMGNIAGVGICSYVSDSRLKTDTLPFNTGLDAIRQMKVKSFKFNGVGGLPSDKAQIGVMAESIRAIPQLSSYAIDTIQIKSNPNDTSLTPEMMDVLTISSNALMFSSINAIKQLDSTVTAMNTGSSTTASNGLVRTGNDLQLGGSLTANTEISLNNHNLSFTDPASPSPSLNAVFIGTNSGSSKLSVVNSTTGAGNNGAADFSATGVGNGTNTGVVILVDGATSVNKGLDINILSNSALSNKAIETKNGDNHFHAFSGTTGFGTAPDHDMKVKVRPDVNNTHSLYVTNKAGNVNAIAVDATSGSIGVWNYSPSPSKAMDIGGDLNLNGGFSGTGPNTYASDANLKSNIAPINNASAIIEQLQPKSFYYDTTNSYGLNFPNQKQYGITAQDIVSILPELVGTEHKAATYDSTGAMLTQATDYKTVNYNAFIAILIKGMQEQKAEIKELKTMITECCANPAALLQNTNNNQQTNTEINSITITPDKSMGNKTLLEQNYPNPFREKTTFNYHLGNEGTVDLSIYTPEGTLVSTIVQQRQTTGDYTIDWDTKEVAPGIYFYSLKVNGLEWVKKAVRVK